MQISKELEKYIRDSYFDLFSENGGVEFIEFDEPSEGYVRYMTAPEDISLEDAVEALGGLADVTVKFCEDQTDVSQPEWVKQWTRDMAKGAL